MQAAIRDHIRTNVVGYVAVFIALAGGTAIAAGTKAPKNSVVSKSIKNGAVKGKDVRSSQVQLRVGGSCPAGEAIRVINVDGGVLCEVDNAGGGAGGGPPSGPAGGSLAGTYPNPTLAPETVGASEIADNAVNTTKVANGSLAGVDIADQSLTGGDVADSSLFGADIVESSLGQVPSATLGGFGRSAGDADDLCDPESSTLIVCTSVDLNLPVQTRALVIGQINARREASANAGSGSCELGTSAVDLPSTSTSLTIGEDDPLALTDNTTMVGVTPPLGPGTVQLRIRCNQTGGALFYTESEIAAVALSPS